MWIILFTHFFANSIDSFLNLHGRGHRQKGYHGHVNMKIGNQVHFGFICQGSAKVCCYLAVCFQSMMWYPEMNSLKHHKVMKSYLAQRVEGV